MPSLMSLETDRIGVRFGTSGKPLLPNRSQQAFVSALEELHIRVGRSMLMEPLRAATPTASCGPSTTFIIHTRSLPRHLARRAAVTAVELIEPDGKSDGVAGTDGDATSTRCNITGQTY